MGLSDAFFGSPSSAEVNPHQENALQQGWLQGMDLLNHSQAMDQYYPFSTVAAMNPLQGAGFQSQVGYAQGLMPELAGMSQQAWGGALNPYGDPAYNAALQSAQGMTQGGMDPYLSSLLGQQTEQFTNAYNQVTNPALESAAIASGAFGGSELAQQQGVAQDDMFRNLGYAQNELLSNAYGQQLGQQQAGAGLLGDLYGSAAGNVNQALGMAGNQMGLGLMPGQTVSGIGDIYQGQNQAQIGDLMGRWDYTQQHPWDLMNQYMTIMGNPVTEQEGGSSGIASMFSPIPLFKTD